MLQQEFTKSECIHALHDELNELTVKYKAYLEQESLTDDVECMNSWIEAYLNGSREASEYLEEHGIGLLDNIRCKLKAAAEELQRIDGESPIAENHTGGQAHRLNKAASLASDAECQLEHMLDCKPH